MKFYGVSLILSVVESDELQDVQAVEDEIRSWFESLRVEVKSLEIVKIGDPG